MALTKIPANLLDKSAHVDFADNEKIRLGDSQDLQIYHDASNSYIKDQGDGQLVLDGNGVILQYSTGTKFATTSSGASVTGNLAVSGNLTVSGTTTELDTTNLNVTDKNITLNYHASSDTSSNADGAGLTIQDAVNASTDATLNWSAANDRFVMSHGLQVTSGNVGIRTSSPDYTLELVGDSMIGDASAVTSPAFAAQQNIVKSFQYGTNGIGRAGNLYLLNTNTNRDSGFLTFGAYYNNTNNLYYQTGGIGGGKETAAGSGWGGYLSFWTTSDGTAGAASAQFEHMRINADGNVGIGDTSPDNKLSIRAASTIGTKNGHIMLTGDSATNGQGPQIVFSESGGSSDFAGASVGYARTGSNGIGYLMFATRGTSGDANTVPTERVRISAEGYMQMGTSIGNSGYSAKFNIVDNAGTSSLIKLRNGTGNKSIQLYGDNNVEYGFVGLDTHSGAANLLLGSADNRSIRMQSGGMQIELTDGQGGTSATDTGSLSITNTDISGGGQVYNIRSGRYLQSNGTGWGTPDGLNPAVVIAKDDNTTNDRSMPGLILHNEDSTDDAYGPSLSWGSRSTSGAYNTSYAWIIGNPTGNGPDTNWKAGQLELYTQGSAYVATKPGIRITSAGLVQKPRQYDANGFFWLRGTANPSGQTGTQPVVFTVRAQAGSGNTSLTSGRYTTPVEGIYHFSTNVRIDAASNNTGYFRIAFYTGTTHDVSQTSYGQGHSIYGPGSYSQNYFSMQTSWSVYLAAGVEVGVAVRFNSGSYTIHQESQFSGHLVG